MIKDRLLQTPVFVSGSKNPDLLFGLPEIPWQSFFMDETQATLFCPANCPSGAYDATLQKEMEKKT